MGCSNLDPLRTGVSSGREYFAGSNSGVSDGRGRLGRSGVVGPCEHSGEPGCSTSATWSTSSRATPGSRGVEPRPLHSRTRRGHCRPPCSLSAPVFSDDPVEDRALCQPFERGDLVSTHEQAVAFDICCEDCDEAAGVRVGHACPNANLWRPVWPVGLPSSRKG